MENVTERFNLTVFKRFWAIAKAYWVSEEKWRARGIPLARGAVVAGLCGAQCGPQ